MGAARRSANVVVAALLLATGTLVAAPAAAGGASAGGGLADGSVEAGAPPGATDPTTIPPVPAPSTLTDPAGPVAAVDVLGGRLDWGMKETFRDYVTGPIARGSITTSGGASVDADGSFSFTAASGGTYDHATRSARVAFDGAVHFRGHGYHDPQAGDLLQLSVSDLRLETSGDRGELVADVLSLTLEGDIGDPQPGGDPVHHDDVVLVELDLTGTGPVKDGTNGLRWNEAPTTLTTAGAPAFEGFYPAGTPFDPASFVLEVAQVPDDVPDAPPPPPSPSAALDASIVRAGDPLTVTGSGFLPGEQVEVWLLPDPGWVSTAVADGTGAVVHTFVVPVTTAPGPHEVELRGISSGLTMRSPVVEVQAAAAATPGQSMPSSASPMLPATGGDELVLALGGLALIASGAALVRLERRARVRQAGSS